MTEFCSAHPTPWDFRNAQLTDLPQAIIRLRLFAARNLGVAGVAMRLSLINPGRLPFDAIR
jgi:hypothetical protein